MIETTESNGTRWVISLIYRASNAQLENFVDGVDEDLKYLITQLPQSEILFCGDMNINFLNADNKNTTKSTA